MGREAFYSWLLVGRLRPLSSLLMRYFSDSCRAVMSSVREFGRAIVQPLGAPAGSLQTFIEVPFKHGEKPCFPDGLIRVVRGQRQWTALVEVKTAGNELETEQLERYLDVAKERTKPGFSGS
ncbi:hypothetical protein [Actinoplanes sp. NPDC051494]|uniref:hypothetical protein n=1 Tax=Actinoplanes sp. NPDC051494 TaxID=3363907 RepID=UPI00379C066E